MSLRENLGTIVALLFVPQQELPLYMQVDGKWLPVVDERTPAVGETLPAVINRLPAQSPVEWQPQRQLQPRPQPQRHEDIEAPYYSPTPAPVHPKLSALMEKGRQYHRAANRQWVAQGDGQLFTCALVAAYAGAFGPGSIRVGMSKDMVIYELSKVTQCDLWKTYSKSADGSRATLANTIIEMNDTGWSRAAIARWLADVGL